MNGSFPAEAERNHWKAYFCGQADSLPAHNLPALAERAMAEVRVQSPWKPAPQLAAFCSMAASRELALEAARLRHQGRFPSVLGLEAGQVLASRLVLNWNLLLIQEGQQRFLVVQGVSSSDAVLLPGLDTLLIVCHIDHARVSECLSILCRDPDFFNPTRRPRFGGYLVGHSRPYHCFYDSYLALQAIREEGLLSATDPLLSKADEAFVDLGDCLGLPQGHTRASREWINDHAAAEGSYLLLLGFWFQARGQEARVRQLAAALDASLRDAAWRQSELAEIGALEALEACHPLIWVGITGQKRRWVEQVEGTVAILNQLQQAFPRLGVVFDGWTPPLASSDYHRQESRKDDRVIARIIRQLRFRTQGRVGITAGLPLLEKVRVGLAVDAFLANYTSGSLNVARICRKPGVGHMGQRMSVSRDQHIHHHTKEVDGALVKDVSSADTPTGYVNYSVPWQAVYNDLVAILAELPLHPERPLLPVPIPPSTPE